MNTLIAVFILSGSSVLIGQEKVPDELQPFKIVVEKTDSGIRLKSIEGSTWGDLSFSNKNYKPQAIDEYGMTELSNVSSDKDSNLADFLFTITKSETGIILKGIEGTAWIDLRFTLLVNEKQAIDQMGMTKLK